MPGVICYRTPSQDCTSLGHLYRSSPYTDTVTRPPRHERQSLQRPRASSTTHSSLSTYLPERKHEHGSGSPVFSIPSLLLLLPEVILLILAELPGRYILRCRSVCKLLKQFIDQSTKLQYIVQANARGLEPLRNSGSARLRLAYLLCRERNWYMFGSISSTHATLISPSHSDDNSAPKAYFVYTSGKLLVCRGDFVIEHTLRLCNARKAQEYEVPGLGDLHYSSVAAGQDLLGFSGNSEVHIYSVLDSKVIQVLSAPHQGVIDSVRFCGDYVAALFHPERRCSGVLIWDWKLGKLIDTLHCVHAPALSFTFLNGTTLALVRIDRSARSARIDVYTFEMHGAVLRSSLALPDAHPTKWYAKASIHTGDNLVPPNSERLKDEEGVIAVDLELRIRAPHDPNTNTTDRRLSVILAIHKQAVMSSIPIASSTTGLTVSAVPTAWPIWSANRFRMINGVRLSSKSAVWGHRIVAMGPELDKISLFDFCSVGVRAASQVWKASSSWGTNTFSGGGVSVRAALAQRARTLVRTNAHGIGAGWFDNINPMVDQMPYVVSIRRGMMGVEDVMLDGDSIVVLRHDEFAEHPTVSKITLFAFSS